MRWCIYLILILLLVSGLDAANYYVSPTGNDSDDGLTIGTAWASIDNGNGMLLPGDTVFVLAGTYAGPVTISDNGQAGDRNVVGVFG